MRDIFTWIVCDRNEWGIIAPKYPLDITIAIEILMRRILNMRRKRLHSFRGERILHTFLPNQGCLIQERRNKLSDKRYLELVGVYFYPYREGIFPSVVGVGMLMHRQEILIDPQIHFFDRKSFKPILGVLGNSWFDTLVWKPSDAELWHDATDNLPRHIRHTFEGIKVTHHQSTATSVHEPASCGFP